MAHQSHIKSEKYRLWVKAGLGLGYLKEGLAPFCDGVSKQQHADILNNIKRVQNVPSVKCGTCTLQTLKPDHVKLGNKQCPLGHVNCNCCYTSGKIACPNNVCGFIYDSIISYHASTPPAPNWKNTQTQQWIADPWSIAKCFISAPGYEQKTSAADTDCTGLLHVIINNKYFHNQVNCKMTGHNIFSKVRQYRNDIFHSSTMELDSPKTNSYIDDMIAVLRDGKELIHRQDAQEAVKKLQDLKNEDFVITTKDVEKVLGDIRQEMGLIKITKKATKEDCEDLKLKVATLNTSISEFKERKMEYGTLKADFQEKLIEEYRENLLPMPAMPCEPENVCAFKDVYVFPRMTIKSKDKDQNYTETEVKTMSEIFVKYDKLLKSIYIVGEAGAGKSSFCKSLVNCWCMAHSNTQDLDGQQIEQNAEDLVDAIQVMKNFNFLFFLPLRHYTDKVSITEMLQEEYEHPVLKKLLERESDTCLIVLDGLDEWKHEAMCPPKRAKFSNYTVITTSRPWKSGSLGISHNEMNLTLHIHGFGKRNEEIQQAVTSNVPDDFENNPYYLKLYTEAISKGEEKDSTIRVNVVGNFGQGKTTLINRLIQEPIAGLESTNSVDIKHCKYMQGNFTLSSIEQLENECDSLERIASVAKADMMKDGQVERKHSQENAVIDSSPISLDLEKQTDPTKDSKTEGDNIKQQFETKTDETNENIKMGHKSIGSFKHKRDENIENIKMGKQILGSFKRKRDQTSFISQHEQERFTKLLQRKQNKDVPKNMEIWDFGGQFSFYATHNLFHSRRAVYILVFDLSKELKSIVTDSEFPDRHEGKSMEQYAKFWINSIHAYVSSENGTKPPVILVGTHKDKLKADEPAKQVIIEEYFEQIRILFDNSNMRKHIQLADFAVDNTNPNDNVLVELRKELIQQGTKLAEISIPAKWIHLERAVRRHSHEKIISFEMLMNLNAENEMPLEDKEQVKLFLRYHHTKGTLLYFDEEPISAYVVVDIQYIIDAFKCIITSNRFCRNDQCCRTLWKSLTTEGRLENELIEKIWGMDQKHNFLKYKKELLMFLEKHLIISEALDYCEESQESHGLGWYIVPSFLPTNTSEVIMKTFLTGRQTSVRYVMLFYNSPLVQVLYYRLLSALIGKWSIIQISSPEKKALIYENLGVFRLDRDHAGVVEYKYDDIELRVIRLCSSSDVTSKCADQFRRFSETIVENEFKKFRPSKTQQEKPYAACFRCNDKRHGLSGGTKNLTLDHIQGKQVEPCPDTLNHFIDHKQILSEWFLEGKIEVLFPERQFNEKELSHVALAIGKNWELLGLELGLEMTQIQRIDMDQTTSEMKNFTMLLKWKDHKKAEATVKTLIHAMETIDRFSINWDSIRNIVDKINSEGHINQLTKMNVL